MASVNAKTVTGIVSGEGRTRLPVLHGCLRGARRRWRIGALLTSAVWSVVAALALLCGQGAAALLFPGPATAGPLRLGEPMSPVAIVLGAFAVAFMLGCVVTYLRTPDLRSFARVIDRKLALRERLSTALEVDAGTRPDAPLDPVRSALIADVERRAADIDPRAIVWLGVSRAIWLVPALILATALLHFVPADAFASRSPAVTRSHNNGALSGEAAEKAAANLRRVADLLGRDAEERADPYLRTIAGAIERLGVEVEHASLDRRQLASALDQLLAHSRQAYAQGGNQDRGEARRNVIDLLAAARDDIAGTTPGHTAALHQPDDAGTAPSGAAAEQAVPDATSAGPPRPQRQARPSAATAPFRSDRATDQVDAQKDGDEYGDLESDPRTQKERAFAEQQRRIRAATQAVGAAADAGAGEGDRAGDGTRPLGNGVAAPTDLAPGVDMLLPDQAGNDGRRIRIELTPQAALSDVAPPTAGGDGNWRRAGERPVARPALDAQDRKVVGRYFTPPAESSGR
jgi:hypothetical protein